MSNAARVECVLCPCSWHLPKSYRSSMLQCRQIPKSLHVCDPRAEACVCGGGGGVGRGVLCWPAAQATGATLQTSFLSHFGTSWKAGTSRLKGGVVLLVWLSFTVRSSSTSPVNFNWFAGELPVLMWIGSPSWRTQNCNVPSTLMVKTETWYVLISTLSTHQRSLICRPCCQRVNIFCAMFVVVDNTVCIYLISIIFKTANKSFLSALTTNLYT